jgi:hypothetical protein
VELGERMGAMPPLPETLQGLVIVGSTDGSISWDLRGMARLQIVRFMHSNAPRPGLEVRSRDARSSVLQHLQLRETGSPSLPVTLQHLEEPEVRHAHPLGLALGTTMLQSWSCVTHGRPGWPRFQMALPAVAEPDHTLFTPF